ncbi:MAG: hypothetical protein HUU55_21095 [Myxococcales bacterium]|nr:hypothetical protein [Myxococcales bacterium]
MDSKKIDQPTVTDTPLVTPRITLAALIERLAVDAKDRNRNFVRHLSMWLHENAPQMQLQIIRKLALTDVVVTLQMRRDVELVITGHLAEPRGEVTLKFCEDEFPSVWVELLAVNTTDPYTICTLDYAQKDRTIKLLEPLTEKGRRLEAGTFAQCLVVSTIGPDAYVRLKSNDSELPWTAPMSAVAFVEEHEFLAQPAP